MASIFQILVVLSSLAASGYSLSCTECSSRSNSCTGPNVTCHSGSVCGAVSKKIWAPGSSGSQTLYEMLCISQDKCNMSGSASLPRNGKMKIGTSCCGTDECTPTLPSLPADSSASNGVICRTCVTADPNGCSSSDRKSCTGDENMCFFLPTKSSGGGISAGGCATKSFCDFSRKDGAQEGVFICTSGSNSGSTSGSTGLHKGFYLPAMIGIFFLKLLI
ncbi:phospholipase A2 inhibitor and Ly6/PLAUR domain-containing protein-like [Rana temporaria]|uniref:phospholipase A2 inhibitor and Ly6/PLAUR domain-containing protein-like n=1 Tax=Rana temporaria TaxID=8407 RepID=UPI001AAD34EB|nr:phospholipase A2 inhibitor and Ly6/PLAUR domain-containing protein-like [Rana temporaria]